MDDELIFRSVTAQTTSEEEERLKAWLAASAGNADRFREVVDVLLLCEAHAEEELMLAPAPSAIDLVSQKPNQRASNRLRTLLLAAAVLASVAVGVPTAQYIWSPTPDTPVGSAFGSAEFVTETKPATVGLLDGSVVRLARESRLRVHDRPNAREVSLVGRGYFAVATHDDGVPFTIVSDAGTVTVLGTRFDLTVNGEDLRLIVIEGRVRLTIRGADVEVGSGQMAQVLRGNLVPPIDVPNPESLIEWVGNFVAFQRTPLREVAKEIEQRHGIRVEFSDSALGDRQITAFFAGRSLDEVTEVICVVAHLECTTTGDVLRMSPIR